MKDSKTLFAAQIFMGMQKIFSENCHQFGHVISKRFAIPKLFFVGSGKVSSKLAIPTPSLFHFMPQ
jgi:hypothetical protein